MRIVLYGAYVCGDFDGQSGIDIAAIVHGERAALQKLLKRFGMNPQNWIQNIERLFPQQLFLMENLA